jgi:hypothetical protein
MNADLRALLQKRHRMPLLLLIPLLHLMLPALLIAHDVA